MTDAHVPVLVDETMAALAIRADGTYVDAKIDYCNASNIYVRNDDVKWD